MVTLSAKPIGQGKGFFENKTRLLLNTGVKYYLLKGQFHENCLSEIDSSIKSRGSAAVSLFCLCCMLGILKTQVWLIPELMNLRRVVAELLIP